MANELTITKPVANLSGRLKAPFLLQLLPTSFLFRTLMFAMLRQFVPSRFHSTWSGICLFCRQPTAQPLLCRYCAEELPLLDHHCRLCGTPLAGGNDFCGHCLLQPPEWDFLHILADFEFPLTGLIHQLKYQHKPLPAALFGRMLAELYPAEETKPEVILPVPLHWRRQWSRGYNQAQEIARPITKQLQIPCNNQLLTRTRATKVQAGLSRELRQTNLNNAFIIRPHTYQHVALLDDVVTTGVTVTTLVRLLKESGCQRVDVWAICRTQLRGE